MIPTLILIIIMKINYPQIHNTPPPILWRRALFKLQNKVLHSQTYIHTNSIFQVRINILKSTPTVIPQFTKSNIRINGHKYLAQSGILFQGSAWRHCAELPRSCRPNIVWRFSVTLCPSAGSPPQVLRYPLT